MSIHCFAMDCLVEVRCNQRCCPEPPIVFLPLMNKPLRSIEKESAEANAKAILDKTCAELRLPNG